MPLADIAPGEQIAWLDDRRVVFTGYHSLPTNRTSVYRWDAAGEVALVFESAKRFCFDGRNLYVVTPRADGAKHYVINGPDFGEAREAVVPITADGPTYSDPFQCLNKPIPPSLLGRTWKRLAPGDGYLDFRPANGFSESLRVAVLKEELTTRLETDLVLSRPILPTVQFAPHRGAYLVYNGNLPPAERHSWRKDGSTTGWWVTAAGKSQAISFPSGPWVTDGGSILMFPVRSGIIFVTYGFDPDGSPGAAGAYLAHGNGEINKIASGLVDNPAVSPDGCRFAFAHQTRIDSARFGRQPHPGRTYSCDRLNKCMF